MNGVRTFHRDDRGAVSVIAVFALLLLTMLLGQVMNSGRQVDAKVRLQNAADAATYSGGVVVARGMNVLAFTNHMLCDVFALTAFMREARDRHGEPFVPEILAAWNNVAPWLAQSGFPKFDALGQAIPQKTPLEQRLVDAYGAWTSATSEMVLPVLEEILAQEMIPQFQRAVVQATPLQVQAAMVEIGRRHGQAVSKTDQARGTLAAVLWRTMADPVGGSGESLLSTLPAVDPAWDLSPAGPQYRQQARQLRDSIARNYLNAWNNEALRPFDTEAKMCQYNSLWRGFTCGQLNRLLNEEYPDSNLPHVIRSRDGEGGDGSDRQYLERDFNFIGVAYWGRLREHAPRLFRSSLTQTSDPQAFAQGMLFVPRARLVWHDERWHAGIDWLDWVRRQNVPQHWDLWNQNWSFQLVPATAESTLAILSLPPPTELTGGTSFRPAQVQGLSVDDFRLINTH